MPQKVLEIFGAAKKKKTQKKKKKKKKGRAGRGPAGTALGCPYIVLGFPRPPHGAAYGAVYVGVGGMYDASVGAMTVCLNLGEGREGAGGGISGGRRARSGRCRRPPAGPGRAGPGQEMRQCKLMQKC